LACPYPFFVGGPMNTAVEMALILPAIAATFPQSEPVKKVSNTTSMTGKEWTRRKSRSKMARSSKKQNRGR